MLVLPHTLSLIVTHRCTAACDHCCFDCSPYKGNSIPVNRLFNYISQAKEVPSLKVVVFTGGECFLLGKNLDKLVRHASDLGFITRFVSNGYWAKTPALAEKRIRELTEQGLQEANFSTGDMHAKFVSPDCVRFGATAAANAGLNTVVMVETFQDSEFNLDDFVFNYSPFKCHVESGAIMLKTSPWMKFNGEALLKQTDPYLQTIRQAGESCSTVLKVLAITPSEDLIACCGLTLEEIDEMHLGSLKNRTIKTILRETADDFMKIWIHLEGPNSVIKYAQTIDADITSPQDFAHICDSCRFVFKNEKIKKAILNHPPPFIEEMKKRYYNSLFIPSFNMDTSTSYKSTYFVAKKLRALANAS